MAQQETASTQEAVRSETSGDESARVYFRSTSAVHELDSAEPFEFHYERTQPVKVLLRKRAEHEPAVDESHRLMAVASTSRRLRERRPLFEALAQQLAWYETQWTAPHGAQTRNTFYEISKYVHAPQSLHDLADSVYTELLDCLTRTVLATIWRLGIDAPAKPLSYPVQEWSLDESTWHLMPAKMREDRWIVRPYWLTDEIRAEVEALAQDPNFDYDARALLSGAWSLIASSEQAVLVLAVAAAEVGTKRCIARLDASQAEAMLQKEAPPLVDLLEKQLTKVPSLIPGMGLVPPPPSQLLDELEKAVTERNKLVHGDRANLDAPFLNRILLSVRDLLWMLDYFMGYEWAAEYARPNLRSAWLGRPPEPS